MSIFRQLRNLHSLRQAQRNTVLRHAFHLCCTCLQTCANLLTWRTKHEHIRCKNNNVVIIKRINAPKQTNWVVIGSDLHYCENKLCMILPCTSTIGLNSGPTTYWIMPFLLTESLNYYSSHERNKEGAQKHAACTRTQHRACGTFWAPLLFSFVITRYNKSSTCHVNRFKMSPIFFVVGSVGRWVVGSWDRCK